MAVTVEGAFVIRDRASRTLKDIERNAQAADRAVAKLGRSLDLVGAKKQVEAMKQVDATMGKLSKQTDAATKAIDKQSNVLDRHRRKVNDNHTALERFGRKMILVFGGLGRVFALMKLPLMIAGFASLIPVIAALGGGVVALLPKLTDLAGVLGALPATFTGLGLAMATVKLSFNGIKEAMGGNAEALKKLTPEARRFTETLKSWKPLVEEFRRSAQRGLFGGLDASLERLRVAAPTINRLLSMMGNRLGALAKQASQQITSQGFLTDLEGVGNQGGRIVTRMGQGVLNLLDALRHVAVAAKPFTDWLSRTLLGWTKMIDASAKAGRETGKLGAFFERTRATLEQFGRIARNVWGVMRDLGRAARPLGQWLWDSAEKATAGWKAFLDSVGGQTQSRMFFNSLQGTLTEVFGLVMDISKALGRLSGNQRGAAELVHGLRGLVSPLEIILGTFQKAFGPPMVAALNEVARTVELLTGNIAGPFALMLKLVTSILAVVNRLITAVPHLGVLVVAAFAAGKLMRITTAVQALAKSWWAVASGATAAAAAESAASGIGPGGVGGGVGGGGWRSRGKFGVPGGKVGPMTAADAAKAARAGSAGRVALRGVGKFAWPVAAIMAGMDAYGAHRTGSIGNQAMQTGSAVLSGLTLGLAPQYRGDDVVASDQFSQYLGGEGMVNTGRRSTRPNPVPIRSSQPQPHMTTTPATGLAAMQKAMSMSMQKPTTVATQGQGLQMQLAGLNSINATTVGEQRTVIERIQTLKTGIEATSKALESEKKLTPEARAAADEQIAQLNEILDVKRDILRTTRQTKNAEARTKIRADAESMTALIDKGRDPVTGRFKDIRAARHLAGARGDLAVSQMAADPAHAAQLGRAALSDATAMEKADPRMKGAAERIRTKVTREFKTLGIDIKKANGKIVDNTDEHWKALETRNAKGAEQLRQQNTKAMTALQRDLVAGLVGKGLTPAAALAAVMAVDASGNLPNAGRPTGASTATPSGGGNPNARARGGRIEGRGLRDTVPIGPNQMAAPGELVVNRHTEARIDSMLGRPGALGNAVSAETVPHYREDKAGVMPGLARGGRVAGVGRPAPPRALDLSGGATGGSPMAKAIRAADAIDAMGYQYAWGGGHGRIGVPSPGTLHSYGGPVGTGFDCSGAVSAVLGAAGLQSSPMVAANYMKWGTPGYDPNGISTVASSGHVYMMIGGKAFGTSTSNPKGGAGWFPGGIRGGFVVNHVANPGSAGDGGTLGSMGALKVPGTPFSGFPGISDLGSNIEMTRAYNKTQDQFANATAGTFDKGGRLPFGGWFGDGGSFVADRPTLIGVGDGGKETVTVKKGRGGGSPTFVFKVGTIVNHGGDVKREVEAAFHALAREIGSMGLSDDGDVIV